MNLTLGGHTAWLTGRQRGGRVTLARVDPAPPRDPQSSTGPLLAAASRAVVAAGGAVFATGVTWPQRLDLVGRVPQPARGSADPHARPVPVGAQSTLASATAIAEVAGTRLAAARRPLTLAHRSRRRRRGRHDRSATATGRRSPSAAARSGSPTTRVTRRAGRSREPPDRSPAHPARQLAGCLTVAGGHLFAAVEAAAPRRRRAGRRRRHTVVWQARVSRDYWDGTSYSGGGGSSGSRRATPCSTSARRPPATAAAARPRRRRGTSRHLGRRTHVHVPDPTRAALLGRQAVTPRTSRRPIFARSTRTGASDALVSYHYYNAIAGFAAYRGRTRHRGPPDTGDHVVPLDAPDGAFPYVIALRFVCIVPAAAPHRPTLRPPPMTGPSRLDLRPGAPRPLTRNPYWRANERTLGLRPGSTAHVDRIQIDIGAGAAGPRRPRRPRPECRPARH